MNEIDQEEQAHEMNESVRRGKTMIKKEMRIVIEEIARVALSMAFTEIADELDLSDAYLLEVRDYLAAQEKSHE